MSTKDERPLQVVEGGKSHDLPSGSEAVRYLREHPEVFLDHPELIEQVRIPHACGQAVSLVEYQVSVLRDRVQVLRQRIDELIANGRASEALSERLHRFSLALMSCGDLSAVFELVRQRLEADFGADTVAVRLFVPAKSEAELALPEFAPAEDSALFAQALGDGRTVCGRLSTTKRRYLFGPEGGEIGSGALLPLGQPGYFGVLAIGSRDPQRFHPSMATTFLSQLAGLVTQSVAPHLLDASVGPDA